MKKCVKCQETKPLTEFYRRAKRPVSGVEHKSDCKMCSHESRRAWGKKNTIKKQEMIKLQIKKGWEEMKKRRIELGIDT